MDLCITRLKLKQRRKNYTVMHKASPMIENARAY